MSGRIVLGAALPRRQRTGRLTRRVGVVVVLAMLLSVGIPAGALPSGPGPGLPVSWLWRWLGEPVSWAKDPKGPEQLRGKGPDGHYQAAARARDSESKVHAKGELARYQPNQLKAENLSTGPAKKGFDPRTSQRVASKATERTDVYQNADGSYTQRIFEEPVNFKAADGSWEPIDSTLRPDAQGRPQVGANAFELSFAGGGARKLDADGQALKTSAAAGDDLVRLTPSKGTELAYSLAGATLGKALVSGQVATYREVLPGVDLELAALSSGVKETLTLRSADAPATYVYPLRLKGLTPRIGADGGVEFVDDTGAVVTTMPLGYLEDSAVDISGAGATSYAMRYELITVDGGPAIRMSVDQAWLKDPKREFPVRVDPDIEMQPIYPFGDTYSLSSETTLTHGANDTVAAGRYDDSVANKARGFLRFGDIPAFFAGNNFKLDSARLHLFQTYQIKDGTNCPQKTTNVYRVTGNWSESTLTWNNQPGDNQAARELAGLQPMASDNTANNAACNNLGGTRNVGTWIAPWLDNAEVKDWAIHNNTYGIVLKANESDPTSWKRFTSSDTVLVCNDSHFGAINCSPWIEVNYTTNAGPEVSAQYPANNTSVSTLTPEFSMQGYDPDNWPGYGVQYQFLVFNDQGVRIADSGLSGNSVWKPNPGVLQWGKQYFYQAKIYDQQVWGPSNPVTYAFSTAVPQPLVSSSLAQNGGKGFEGSVGNYTTSDVDAQVTTVGPALAINRDYNSLDTRATSSFGQGWSSVTDMQVREGKDAGGALQTATVRYPSGQEIAFGRNNDGSWTPPPGRYSVFKPITGGYSLTDKDSTTYEFTRSQVTGVYGLTKITDPSARSVTYHYDASGHIDMMQSLASQRALHLTWSTPPDATAAHVAAVTTDPTDPAVSSSTLTWAYTYTGDKLTKVCPPGTATDCASYEYQIVNQAPSSVLNTGPYSYWRLNEGAGATQAQSGVLSNDGTDNGIYTNVTLGGAAALDQSAATTASFNGTNSSVKLPIKLATESSYQSISLWFKTSTPLGVLFSNQTSTVAPGVTPTGGYDPVLYIDSDGKLRGEFWNGTGNPVTTTGTVTNNQWHHVALSGNGGSQKLYLDGEPVGTASGNIVLHNTGQSNLYLGAGILGGSWPGQSFATPTPVFFNGSLADAAYYNKPLTDAMVTALYTAGRNPAPAMTKVTSNAGRVRAQITYDNVNGRVHQVTDEAGGAWQIGVPATSGSSQLYASTVLGSRPNEYYRFNDITLPQGPYSQVASGFQWRYNNVTFDTTQTGTSPFSDSHGAIFNGTSSYVRAGDYDKFQEMPLWNPVSIEMWFKTPANYAASGVLYANQAATVDGPNPNTPNWVPILYVGGDGYLRGQFWNTTFAPITSTAKVNDGNWHHVVLTAERTTGDFGANKQSMYLDNTIVGTKTDGWLDDPGGIYAYIGAGTTQNWPGSTSTVSYFKGDIAEFAYYDHSLTVDQVDAHYKASRSALGVPGTLTPVSSVAVTDPGGKTSTRTYDVLSGSRLIADTDAVGNTTTYGYDVAGFVTVVYDPLGQKTETAKDVRGNTVRTTTCSNETAGQCESTLYKYYPDSTSVNLTPDGRNDQVTEVSHSDQWSSGLAVTKLTYDGPAGNRTTMTSPPVPGFPNGRTTTIAYTTATTAAVGGGVTPAGLPTTTTSPGGGVQRTEYNAAGDAVRVTDPAGLVTEFSYDGIGRVKQQKILAPGYSNGLVTSYRFDQETLVETTEPTVTNAISGAQHQARTTDVVDADGNILSRTVSDVTGGDSPRSVTSEYNTHGQLVKSNDPTGAVTLYGYDVYGRQNQRVNCDSSPAAGSPCPAGDRLQTLGQAFDANGKLLTSTLTGKDGTAVQETYNVYYANGDLASTTDAMGWTTKYEYWDDGKVKKVSRTDGTKTTVLQENYYDSLGNLISVTQNNGATEVDQKFDDAGRMQSTMTYTTDRSIDGPPDGRGTNFIYDADDHVVGTRHVAGNPLYVTQVMSDERSTYDPMGRLTSHSVGVDGASGPAAWWKLDETAGTDPNNNLGVTVTDSSGSRLDANADVRDGTTLGNGYASFNTSTPIETEYPVLNTTQSYSVSAWVKLNSFSGESTFVGQGGDNIGAFFVLYHSGNGKWTFIAPNTDSQNPSAWNNATAGTAVATNQWVHLVAVFDASTKRMSLYANNVRGTDATNPTPFNSTGGTFIGGTHGRLGGPSWKLNGAVDNVQVFQRALTDADVAALWNSGNGRSNQVALTGSALTTNYAVDQRGLTTGMTDPNGNTTSYVYDEDGNLTKTLAPSVLVETSGQTAVSVRPTTVQGYNAFGETVEVQDPLGNVATTRRDAAGRAWKTILPAYTQPGAGGQTIIDASTTSTFDKLGRTTSTTDPRGKTTSYEYDTLGHVTKTTDPAGKVSTAKYDQIGDVLETVDPTGAKTSATYDYLSRKVTSTQWERQPTQQAYVTTYDYGTGAYGSSANSGPWLRKVTSPDGVKAESTYNNVGEVVSSKDPAGNVTTTSYDALGRPVTVTRPDGTKSVTTYDAAGRAVKSQELNAASTVLTTNTAGYDNNGNLRTSTDARNSTTTLTYNALNQVTDVSQPVTTSTSIHTSYGYDAAGHQTRFTDGRSNQFWNTYNTWGLPESQIEPATIAYPGAADRTFTAVYDAGGRMTAQLQPGGVRVDYAYDDLNRLTGQSGSGAEAATATRTLGYDDAGRLTSLSVPGGTDTITYNDRGLPLTITGPSDSTTYTYTNDGRAASRVDAAGTTNFTYDPAGRFQTASNTTTTNINVTATYNNMSLPQTIVYGSSNQTRTFTYDDLHRLTNDQLKQTSGSTILGNIAYGYDANGNETSKTTTGFAGASTNTYTYDLANRLTSWTSGSTVTNYEYDASGNRTRNGSKTFAYDQRNQLASASDGTTYTYSARGTLRQTSNSGGVYATTADAYGQVITQQAAGGTSTNQYDAAGRVVRTGFKYSGLGNTLAQDSAATYTRGPSGELLGAGSGTGASSNYVWTDQHADVVGQFKATSTSLTGSASYDPLGKVLATSALVGNLGYQSEWKDSTTGRVNMLARWYNTDTGQFDTRDPVANSPIPAAVAANRFQYAGDNPLTNVDPDGTSFWSKLNNAASKVTNVVNHSVQVIQNTYNYIETKTSQAWDYVTTKASDLGNYVWDKTKKASKVVADSTTKWVKNKYNDVKDKYNQAKQCLQGGVSKCVQETAKAAVKHVADTVKSTVDAIKQDPWKFVATAAVGILATVAVGALCATGVGCLILAGAIAGAMQAGAGYMVDVARGDAEFSWSGLADTMIEGGLDGALSAGVGKFTGGATKFMSKPFKAAGAGGMKKAFGGGSKEATALRRSRGGSGEGSPESTGPKRSGGAGSDDGDGPTGGQSGDGSGGGCRNGGPRHSFAPDTPVLLADGTTKKIEDVKLGDELAATDPATDTTSAKPVTKLWRNHDTDLTDVTVRVSTPTSGHTALAPNASRLSRVGAALVTAAAVTVGMTTTVLHTTQHHPFWDRTTNTWIDAADLQPGDQLQTDAGATAEVAAVRNLTGAADMRDLTIADIHTYYVVAGDTPVLVHNCGLSDRASEIHAAEPDQYVRDNVNTVSVVRAQTPHGVVDVIAGSGDGLTPAQMSVPLRPGEMHAPNIPGTHAEQNAFLFINQQGWTPIAGGSSRNVCLSVCAPWIRGTGGRMMGKVYHGSFLTTTRQRSFEW
ncbi:LamG-like jellyroll fold domain-containing protein [Dactylosporangium sp. CA-092794]|uniref:LamG-like jellyroll fold domain-containing protein n=1 Tax=Dactylosporangium sp. CA-092794 TaxID=3239929 RepID=UPI003D939B0C